LFQRRSDLALNLVGGERRGGGVDLDLDRRRVGKRIDVNEQKRGQPEKGAAACSQDHDGPVTQRQIDQPVQHNETSNTICESGLTPPPTPPRSGEGRRFLLPSPLWGGVGGGVLPPVPNHATQCQAASGFFVRPDRAYLWHSAQPAPRLPLSNSARRAPLPPDATISPGDTPAMISVVLPTTAPGRTERM